MAGTGADVVNTFSASETAGLATGGDAILLSDSVRTRLDGLAPTLSTSRGLRSTGSARRRIGSATRRIGRCLTGMGRC